MHTFSFTFYKNSKEDEKGRLIAMMDGFQAGDPLQIAYRGFVQHQHAATMEDAETVARSVADKIYCLFNHPDARPVNYRGPSMSIGDVVEIQGRCFAVQKRFGFSKADIWASPITIGDVRWNPALAGESEL